MILTLRFLTRARETSNWMHPMFLLLLFSDECAFQVSEKVKKRNVKISESENPREIRHVYRCREKR